MNLQDLLNANNTLPLADKPIDRARLYVRVSHERSAEKNISPETQRQRISAYCRERGYEMHSWYEDMALSAFRDDDLRLEWNRMIADAKADPLTTVIVVWRYDRFSRGDNAQVIQRELLKSGVRIESAEEGYYDPDSETGAIMMPLTWSLNRLFSIKLRNVVIPNMKVNFESRDPETGWAYKNGGWSMFGYKKHRLKIGRSHKHTDIHKVVWLLDDTVIGGKQLHEWARIMLLEWRLKDRLGYDSIAAKLTAAGIPTPSGKAAWAPSTIKSLIGTWDRLYQYTGTAFWNREDCTDRGNRKTRDTSEWIVVENAHPAIITTAEAEGIHAMVREQQKPKSGRGGEVSKFALSGGGLVCEHCGSNYAGAKRKANDYYVCGSHLYRRGVDCGAPSWYIPREDVENLVLSKILAKLDINDAAMDAWVSEINELIDQQRRPYEQTQIEREKIIADLEKKLSGYYDIVALAGSAGELEDRIKEAHASLLRMKRLDGAELPERISVEDVKRLKAEVVEGINSDRIEARRRVIKMFNVKITVNANTRELSGSLDDPRSLVYNSLAVPRGVEPLSRP